MTISAQISTNESFAIGTISLESQSDRPSVVLFAEFAQARRPPIPGAKAFSDIVREYERDPEKAAKIAAARKRLVGDLYGGGPETLASLRLAAGLSQTQLATLMQSTQPHLSNVELGKQDPTTDFVARLSAALHVDPVRVFQAIRAQRGVFAR